MRLMKERLTRVRRGRLRFPIRGAQTAPPEPESPIPFSPLLQSPGTLSFPLGSIPPDEEGIVAHPDENPMTANAGKCD